MNVRWLLRYDKHNNNIHNEHNIEIIIVIIIELFVCSERKWSIAKSINTTQTRLGEWPPPIINLFSHYYFVIVIVAVVVVVVVLLQSSSNARIKGLEEQAANDAYRIECLQSDLVRCYLMCELISCVKQPVFFFFTSITASCERRERCESGVVVGSIGCIGCGCWRRRQTISMLLLLLLLRVSAQCWCVRSTRRMTTTLHWGICVVNEMTLWDVLIKWVIKVIAL